MPSFPYFSVVISKSKRSTIKVNFQLLQIGSLGYYTAEDKSVKIAIFLGSNIKRFYCNFSVRYPAWMQSACSGINQHRSWFSQDKNSQLAARSARISAIFGSFGSPVPPPSPSWLEGIVQDVETSSVPEEANQSLHKARRIWNQSFIYMELSCPELGKNGYSKSWEPLEWSVLTELLSSRSSDGCTKRTVKTLVGWSGGSGRRRHCGPALCSGFVGFLEEATLVLSVVKDGLYSYCLCSTSSSVN